jgi:phthalate 4,5-cis-dihydrodiol dehydrogenase
MGDESAAKAARNYGGAHEKPRAAPIAHEHFGVVVVSCERGDIRPTPRGVFVYGDAAATFDELPPPDIPRREVIDELVAAAGGAAPLHDARWGRDTLAVCLAMLASAREGREVAL